MTSTQPHPVQTTDTGIPVQSDKYSLTVGALNMISAGGSTLVVTLSPSIATSGNLTGTIGSTATVPFGIGGSFTLLSGTPSGAYTGTFAVSVAYN